MRAGQRSFSDLCLFPLTFPLPPLDRHPMLAFCSFDSYLLALDWLDGKDRKAK